MWRNHRVLKKQEKEWSLAEEPLLLGTEGQNFTIAYPRPPSGQVHVLQPSLALKQPG